ncbi:putative integral membrane protein [Mycobacterium tuberculosis]|nr:putative integral membrane protein [Mycobacterium tuberculosis]
MTMARVRRGTELLLSPQSPPATGGLIVLTGLRLLAGLIWLYNVVWKVPPDFGERGRRDLYHFTHLAVEHPVFTPFSWVIEHAVLPYFTAFGWGVLFAESALAVLLLTGTAVRLAARTAAQRLLAGWGIVLGLIGLVAVWRGLGDDRPAYVGIRALEFSLGEYNLRGALALIAIALAMLAAAKRGWRTVALVAAVVAVAAAAAIYLQVGRTAVWLGGTNTTAAVFVCAAVVSLATEFRIGRVEGA